MVMLDGVVLLEPSSQRNVLHSKIHNFDKLQSGSSATSNPEILSSHVVKGKELKDFKVVRYEIAKGG